MSATMSEIGKLLEKYEPKISIQQNITISNYYYLHDKFKKFNLNCLYVCKSSQLPENICHDNLINLLIIIDSPLPSYLQWWDKYNLIFLQESKCSIYTILEELQDFINIDSVLGHFTKNIIESISQNAPLDELIKIAYNYLENPIILTNSSKYICSSYKGDNDINEPLWENYINTGFCDIKYLKNIYDDLNFRQSLSFFNEPIIVDYFDTMNHRMLISCLKKENFYMSYIYVLEVNKPFNKTDIEILNIMNKILLPIISNDSRFLITNNTAFDFIFYYLINCENINCEYIDDYINIFNLQLKSNLSLIHIENLESSISFSQIQNINNSLKRIFYNHYIYFYLGKIYIIYNEDKPLRDNELNLLCKLLKENNLKAGISQCLSNLEDLKNSITQSHNAIVIGSKINPDKFIYYFDDYIINNLVFSFLKYNNINDLVDINLMDFIDNNNEDFVNTLKLYCLNNGDLQKTSNELHIHYNTLKYRLQKIKDLYCLDVFNNKSILNMKLSFLALDMLENNM